MASERDGPMICAGENEGTTGMLVVDSVIPGGPADGLLEPGDVLVRIQGDVVVHFLPMESLLDDHVGQHVTVEIERGGEMLVRSVLVSPAQQSCLLPLHFTRQRWGAHDPSVFVG